MKHDDEQEKSTPAATPYAQIAPVRAIDDEQVKDFLRILREYKTGKLHTERRVVEAESWWKLRNTEQEQCEIGADGGFVSRSGWLHNVITSKHADAMDAFPEPVILPREAGDKAEAERLSAILPCVLEQVDFESVYSEAQWAKLKYGTPVYKIIWDKDRLGGLGEISIECVSLLNVFWEPGKKDIQTSRYFFHTDLQDNDLLCERYPQLKGRLRDSGFLATRFLYDDTVKTDGKTTVVDVYYHKNGRLHYCKFAGDTVLYATENDPAAMHRGLYDHGLYPFVFDPLFPIEGSPCGYGYIDLCANPQTAVDLLDTAFVKNAMSGAVPRYLSRSDGNINESELLDLSKPIVHVQGNVDEATVRQILFAPMGAGSVNVRDSKILELRQTSGNTESSTGNTGAGVTAASAIIALQEASGKGSRDSSLSAYRSFRKIITLSIELIRQFYELPRQFRILGENGAERFVSYDNRGLKPQPLGTLFGQPMGLRKPVFDIHIEAQKRTAYSRLAQNELAMQFYQAGFFNPQLAEQALLCLGMMDFDGREMLLQKIAVNAAVHKALQEFAGLAVQLAGQINPQLQAQLAQKAQAVLGGLPTLKVGATQALGVGGTQAVGGGATQAPLRKELLQRAKTQTAAKPEA